MSLKRLDRETIERVMFEPVTCGKCQKSVLGIRIWRESSTCLECLRESPGLLFELIQEMSQYVGRLGNYFGKCAPSLIDDPELGAEVLSTLCYLARRVAVANQVIDEEGNQLPGNYRAE